MEQNNQLQIFKPGPLYAKRFEIVNQIKTNMRTGDILYRYSDAKGPFGLPFTRLVADITKSEYSHAAMLFIENGEPHVLEVNDQGTLRYRLLDWIDTCYGTTFSVCRLKNLTTQQEIALSVRIQAFLNEDPDYDFKFSDSNKYYCTESVIHIYNDALGIKIDDGWFIKDIVPTWKYWLLRAGVFLFSFMGVSLPFDKKLHFVGNEERGMLSSKYTTLIHKI